MPAGVVRKCCSWSTWNLVCAGHGVTSAAHVSQATRTRQTIRHHATNQQPPQHSATEHCRASDRPLGIARDATRSPESRKAQSSFLDGAKGLGTWRGTTAQVDAVSAPSKRCATAVPPSHTWRRLHVSVDRQRRQNCLSVGQQGRLTLRHTGVSHNAYAPCSGCSLLIIIIWAGGMAPAVLYFGTTIYVDFNMWRQSLKIPTTAKSTDPLATFVWHEEYETVNLREHIAAHATYRHRTPFPHTVIDDIIPQDLLERVNAELPEDSDEFG